ncbi:hypothetical protein FOA43_002803 [Brettanomyces nanus]|uniref:Cyclin n=1 Tax=Eeniella nana TaxID=13502 RepID=A0A875S3C7_EENNA|nr:uncharacterized protein FOA43_002803 [Brettanomyces nanus]QPG75448.1 hypothetical protein FOA43_002803 [Brettanomyces nanus]
MEEISVKLKPQQPTFEDDKGETNTKEGDGELDEKITKEKGQESEQDGNKEEDLETNREDGKCFKQDTSDSKNGSLNKEDSSLSGTKERSPERIRPPAISSVNMDLFIDNKIDKLGCLNDLKQIEAMAFFKRLVDDLMTLDYVVKEDPEIDLRSLLFDNMHDVLTPGQDLCDEINDDEGSVDSFTDDNRDRFPTLLEKPMSQLKDEKRTDRNSALEKLKSVSNEQLEVPLRKNSRIDANFEDASETAFTDDDFRRKSGSYHQNIDHELCTKIIQKFYLKQAPSLSITQYLERINKFITPSPAVLLSASYFLFNVAFDLKPENNCSLLPLQSPPEEEGPIKMTSVDSLDIFRLVLSALRISLKLIEDKNFKQAYYCKITGLQHIDDLFKLELAFLYLLNFNLFINEFSLTRFLFQFKVFDTNLRRYLKSRTV